MLRTFRHRGLKRLFERGDKSKLRADQVERIEEILSRLDAAAGTKDLNTPGYRLHPLKGDMQASGVFGFPPTGGSCSALRLATPAM